MSRLAFPFERLPARIDFLTSRIVEDDALIEVSLDVTVLAPLVGAPEDPLDRAPCDAARAIEQAA